MPSKDANRVFFRIDQLRIVKAAHTDAREFFKKNNMQIESLAKTQLTDDPAIETAKQELLTAKNFFSQPYV